MHVHVHGVLSIKISAPPEEEFSRVKMPHEADQLMTDSECACTACISNGHQNTHALHASQMGKNSLQSQRSVSGLQDYLPQQGMLEGVTSFAHKAATCSKAPVTPSFFEVQGTWIATLSLTCTQQPAPLGYCTRLASQS